MKFDSVESCVQTQTVPYVSGRIFNRNSGLNAGILCRSKDRINE